MNILCSRYSQYTLYAFSFALHLHSIQDGADYKTEAKDHELEEEKAEKHNRYVSNRLVQRDAEFRFSPLLL